MQNTILIKIFNLTAKKEIIWSKADTQIDNCNRYEGDHEKCNFVIMEMEDYDSYVGFEEKGKDNFIKVDADKKDIEMFIKIIKATKIKERKVLENVC